MTRIPYRLVSGKNILTTISLFTMCQTGPAWAEISGSAAPEVDAPASQTVHPLLPVEPATPAATSQSISSAEPATPAVAAGDTKATASPADPQSASTSGKKRVEATITYTTIPALPVPAGSITDSLNDLVTAAKEHNQDLESVRAFLKKYVSKKQRLKAAGADALNQIVMYKGVSISSKAGDIILDEKMKLDSLGAAKFMMRKLEDQTEIDVTAAVLDLADVVGNNKYPPSDRKTRIREAYEKLENLAGKDAASKFVTAMRHSELVPDPLPKLPSSHRFSEQAERINLAVQCAALQDNIVEDIKKDIHKYNHHSQAVMAFHRITRTTLCLISLTPNLAGPAAQAALFGYVMISGGSEESKLMKELYIGKRLDSRASALKEEMHMLFDGYKVGKAGNNRVLMTCAEKILSGKIGADNAIKLLRGTQPAAAIASQLTVPNPVIR